MGSRLSFFRKTLDIEDKQSGDVNNKVLSSELTKPAQPSQPTPICADIVNVGPKCQCLDCKCDPCSCPLKKGLLDIDSAQEVIVEATVDQSTDKPGDDTPQPTHEQEVTAQIESSQRIDESKQSAETAAEKVTTSEAKPSEEVRVEGLQADETKETSSPECDKHEVEAEVVQKDKAHDKTCFCDPCHCNPCKCCGQESEVTPQDKLVDEFRSQAPESELKTHDAEPQQSNEEQRHENNESENRDNKENVAEAQHPIDENVNVPQEGQALEVQTHD